MILRNWSENDIDDLVEGLNNIEVSKWLSTTPHPYTRENAAAYIDNCVKNLSVEHNPTTYSFAIELKSEKKVIGGTTLKQINTFHGTAGGGIWLNVNYHGFGYGTEAFGKRIEFAFKVLNLRRLENGFLEGNQASKRMQEKLGYVIEGKRRKGFLCMADGKLKDEYTTSLLIDEWHAMQETLYSQSIPGMTESILEGKST